MDVIGADILSLKKFNFKKRYILFIINFKIIIVFCYFKQSFLDK